MTSVQTQVHRFPRYPQYGPAPPWLAQLPVHWSVKRLRFLASLNPSKSEVSRLPGDTLVSFVPMEAVGEQGELSLDLSRSLTDVYAGYTFFRDGDVVVAKITPCFENGKGTVMDGLANGLGFGTSEFHVLRPSRSLDARYLWYLTASEPLRALGEVEMKGAAGQKRVPEEFLLNFRAPLPPLEEQRAIAAFLDRETAKIDELVAKKERLIELLGEKRAAVITHAVTKGLEPNAPMKDSGIEWLGDVPTHWRILQLKRVVDVTRPITYGIVQPGEPDPHGILMVRGQNYSNGWSHPDAIFRVSPAVEAPYRRARLRSGDIVMTIVGAGTGNTAIVPDWLTGANLTQTTARIAVDSAHSARFVRYFLGSAAGQANVDVSVKGAAQPGLNLAHLVRYLIPLPPQSEQDAIADALDEAMIQVDRLMERICSAVKHLNEYRSALISAAVTGKIDVRGEVP